MTGQAVALIALLVAVVAVVVPLLRRDLRRAEQRRLGGWLVDLATGKVTRSQAVPYGKAYVLPPQPLPQPVLRLPEPTEADFERMKRQFLLAERAAMTVVKPGTFVKFSAV